MQKAKSDTDEGLKGRSTGSKINGDKVRGGEKSDTNRASLKTPTDLTDKQTAAVAQAVNGLVADAFVLYMKTKNFHWHVAGPHFRDYHIMLDEQADQIFASIDPLAERVRKLGHKTLHSFGEILKKASLQENADDYVAPYEMLAELVEDNKAMTNAMRDAHSVCDDNGDVATASLLEVYIDETERRTWFLFETARHADAGGH